MKKVRSKDVNYDLIKLSSTYEKDVNIRDRIEDQNISHSKENFSYFELNKLSGNFSERHSKRKQLEEDVMIETLEKIREENFTFDNTDRPLIVYSYSETPSSHANALFFIKYGLHASADFIFIINGQSNLSSLLPISEEAPNIKVIKRNNSCYDLGAYGEVLRKNDRELVQKYKKFILINSSIRGPFIPSWANACWSDIYLSRLSDSVKLVGLSYNCLPIRHVQSMLLATDRAGIEILLNGDTTDTTNTTDLKYKEEVGNPESLLGLSSCYKTRYKAISAEMSLTNLMLRESYNVSVLAATDFLGFSFYKNCSSADVNTDQPNYRLEWEKVHPYETLFIKANRDIHLDPSMVRDLTSYHYRSSKTSWNLYRSRNQ